MQVKPKRVLKLSGSGVKKSKRFKVSDPWKIGYSYDCSNFGFKGNFIITVHQNGAPVDLGVNELKKKGKGSTPIYRSGRFHLEINSTCDWKVKVWDLPDED